MWQKRLLMSACLAGVLFAAAPVQGEHGKSPATLRALTPCVSDSKWAKGWWEKRHQDKLKAIQAGGAEVVFIGDSITHGWEGAGAAVWNRFFKSGKRRALNLGYSADRTEHVLWRLTHGELDGYKAKCILLMIGSNNTGHFPFEEEPPVDTILGIREILRVIAEKQPDARVVLTSIFPRGRDAQDALRRRNDVVNKEIAKFADGRRVIWCDFSDKFLSADGRLSAELFPDHLHPAERGYEIWASAVIPLIDKILAASPDEVIASVWPSNPQGYSFVTPTPARPENRWWGTRNREKREEIVRNGGAEYDLVMVGDSITHIWERQKEGWAQNAKLKEMFRVLNLGYGGDRTQHVIWRLQNGELEGYKAKVFTLMIGTNNPDRNAADVAAGIKTILALIRTKHPEAKIVLMPIFPRGASARDDRRVRNEAVNKIIKEYADGTDVLWLDFNDRFVDASGQLRPGLMTKDNLHLEDAGYAVWREALTPVVRRLIGK